MKTQCGILDLIWHENLAFGRLTEKKLFKKTCKITGKVILHVFLSRCREEI